MFFVVFVVVKLFSSGRVVLYNVFMVFPLPQTLANNLVTNLAKNSSDKLIESSRKNKSKTSLKN